ncbi:MAG: hypothetical protein U0821_04215 [Chloroflexota bacterium]
MTGALATVGAVMLLLYGALVVSLPGLSEARSVPIQKAVDIRDDFGAAHVASSVAFLAVIIALFVAYALALRATRRIGMRHAARPILAFTAAYQLLAVVSPTMLSTDVYSYLMYGRILAVHGANPYLDAPDRFASDPYYGLLFWTTYTSFYGPLWTLLSAGVSRVVGEDATLAALAFRGLAGTCAVASTGLVWLTLRRLRPNDAARGAVAFGWNPLLFIECGLSGHNDALLVAGVAAALLLLVRGRATSAAASLLGAACVKVLALPMLPLLLAHAWRADRARLAFVMRTGLLLSALLVVLVFPVWGGPQTLSTLLLGGAGDRYTNSLGELALTELRVAFGESREDTEVPLLFSPWWIATTRPAPLRAERGDNAPSLVEIPRGQALLVVAPQYGRWARVFHPTTHQTGFIRTNATERQAVAPDRGSLDAETLARERGPTGSPALAGANAIVRGVGWGTFFLVWGWVLLRCTARVEHLVRGLVILMVVTYYLTLTWFHPWHLLAGLLLAALSPLTPAAIAMFSLTASATLIYPALGFLPGSAEPRLEWLFTYRALAVFGLPVLVLGGWMIGRRANHEPA